jgi:hypothetical protein
MRFMVQNGDSMRWFPVLVLAASTALAGEPSFASLFDPADPSAADNKLRRDAFTAAVARDGLAGAIRRMPDFERGLDALTKQMLKDEVVYRKAKDAYDGWCEKYKKEYVKKHGRDPVDLAIPDAINKEFIRKEEVFQQSRAKVLNERRFHEWVLEQCAEALAGGALKDHRPAVDALLAGLRNRNDFHAARCAALLRHATDAESGKDVEAACKRESDPAVLGLLLEAHPAGDALARYFTHDAWQARAGAIRRAVRARDLTAVRQLVDALAREEGRLRDDAADALRAVTLETMGSDAAAWRAWLEKLPADWEAPPPPKEAPPPMQERGFGPDLSAAPGVFSDGPDVFLGLRSHSRAMVFLVESNGDATREVLAKAVDALPDGTEFGIVLYEGEASAWRRKLVRADAGTRAAARTWIEKFKARAGGADPYEGLRVALDLAGADGGAADTLLFLTIYGPATGLYKDPRQVAYEVLPLVRRLGIRVHAHGKSTGADGWWLQELCNASGGTFKPLG